MTTARTHNSRFATIAADGTHSIIENILNFITIFVADMHGMSLRKQALSVVHHLKTTVIILNAWNIFRRQAFQMNLTYRQTNYLISSKILVGLTAKMTSGF